jgi:hypothetical protein
MRTKAAASSSVSRRIVAIVQQGVGVLKMSLAMEQIVGAYVRLRDREALEKLRIHRQTLMDDLNSARPDLSLDTSQVLRNLAGDLAAIDASFEQLDAAMRGER